MLFLEMAGRRPYPKIIFVDGLDICLAPMAAEALRRIAAQHGLRLGTIQSAGYLQNVAGVAADPGWRDIAGFTGVVLDEHQSRHLRTIRSWRDTDVFVSMSDDATTYLKTEGVPHHRIAQMTVRNPHRLPEAVHRYAFTRICAWFDQALTLPEGTTARACKEKQKTERAS